MKIQTLIVTTEQVDHSLLEKMNVQTDAIIGNQCDRNEVEAFDYSGHSIKWISMCERGVGLNRNTVMMRSEADICVFADDDMVFHDGYADTVKKVFEEYSDADIIVFNLDERVPKRYNNSKVIKVNLKNYGKYGAARIAFRRHSVHMAGVFFHLMFGGGAVYSSGEDTVFIHECLKRKLKIIAVPIAIAELKNERESTWFSGYNDKFFVDKGVLYGHIYRKRARFIALYNCLKHRKDCYREYGWRKAYQRMCEGIRIISKK